MSYPRVFGLKDVFTTVNAVGGAVAVLLCVEGLPFEAGIAVMLGYFLGDALDGPVARWTNSSNRFGSEYDTIADHLAHCVAPAAVFYTAYRNAELGLSPASTRAIALAAAVLIMALGTYRHARNAVIPVSVPGFWTGLPRTQVGFLALSCANSVLLPRLPLGAWLGLGLLLVACALSLTYLPFTDHRPERRHFWHVRGLIVLYLGSTVTTLALAPRLLFDVLGLWMLLYITGAWLGMTAEERAEHQRAVRAARLSPLS